MADALRRQQKRYPSFAEQLDELVKRVLVHAHRTRESDCDRVIAALREWGALNIRELIEETELSHWDARQVLADLIEQGKVLETRPQIPKVPPAGRPYVYTLKG